MILLQVLYFSLFIDELTFLILMFLFSDDPVVVDSLSFFLIIGQQFLLLLVSFLEFSQFLAH